MAGQSTHGLGRAGIGISVKGRVTPNGDPSLPPLSVRGLGFNAFVSGPYRLEGERSRVVTSPTVLPSNSECACTRGEGSWIGSLRSRPGPRGRRRSFDPCHESLRGNGRVRGPFHSTRSADRGVNILPRAARERMAFLLDSLVPLL